MSDHQNGFVINPAALEPLFKPWEEPDSHRVKADRPGEPAKIIKNRRPTPITIAQNLRSAVRDWREGFYAGASDTTRYLLDHWFNRSHRKKNPDGEEYEFHYYFCQQEAIETLIYLKEVRRLNCLSQIVEEFAGTNSELMALGITEEEDLWSRYAFKMATGSGKTKVMSLAMVWSYFHSLRESDSEMARHFVAIAPNLTVYERLREDFKPVDGGPDIFDDDPLIPAEWRGDWNLSVVLQDEAGGTATGGVLYLTNIHRLYDMSKRKTKKDGETYSWVGPSVSKSKALDTGAALRDRITSHKGIMILNDEAHHVWDSDSAWNEAINYLHDSIKSRTGGGIVSQLDFSATPKDNKGQLFKHIICDTPLGEAVDAGIVKTPIIGRADQKLAEEPGDNAAYIFDRHLRLGYERWKASQQEWKRSNKKALLFVMCEDTKAANDIANRLNTDEVFKELNSKTINLHTNLKGKVKKVGKGQNAQVVFVESDKEISDEDLKALRKLSRELDHNSSPYSCIVSVLMLREGWDIRNVTTIVPLRPYSSKANILPEQTLGRGLRRITPPGGANELVTVVDHPAFASLYQQELAQEGLPIEIIDVDRIPATTVSIYPDEARKDIRKLDIAVPPLSPGHRIIPSLKGLTIEDVKKEFSKYKPLPLGSKGATEINYEGRHLFTGELVEKLKIHLPLLESGFGAVSYFVKQLETICKLRGLHSTLAPLVQTFLEEILFEKKTDLFDQQLIARLGDSDVAEHIRAVFVPLIRARTITSEVRAPSAEPVNVSGWKPYQVTHSERHPVLEAAKTLFNLVPCNRDLEVAMAKFLEIASDIAAFAKNAGPQCLRIDYLAIGGQLAFYTPDFFVRTTAGHCYLVETKGREDRDVPRKARAAVEWCKSASSKTCKWNYLYVPQGVFETLTGQTIEELARTCAPALQNLLTEEDFKTQYPLFASVTAVEEQRVSEAKGLVDEEIMKSLPDRYRKDAEQAISLFRFLENKPGIDYSPVFQPLLGSIDEASKGLIKRRLLPLVPSPVQERNAWFAPYWERVASRDRKHYENMAQNLKKTLVFDNGVSPIGLLRNCIDYAMNDSTKIGGVFEAVREKFKVKGAMDLLTVVTKINDFRNTRVAHKEKDLPLTDGNLTKANLLVWIQGLKTISETE
ncbi:MAG: DEAD/DEAH box helicase family protein [Sedimentisphaerales bacterium]|jgi:type III restriction enzyme